MDRLPTPAFLDFPGGPDGKKPARNVGDPGWDDPLEEGMVTHSSILAWRLPMDKNLAGYSLWGRKASGHDWAPKHRDP